MDTYTEKRSFQRHTASTEILWSHFNSSPRYQDSKIINYGQGGLSFESNVMLQPGTPIIIKMRNGQSKLLATREYAGFPTARVGEVRWCNEGGGKGNGDAPYVVGIKYHGPYHY